MSPEAMELRAAPGGGVLELLFAAPFFGPVFGSYWADSNALGSDLLPGLTARRKDRLSALAELRRDEETMAVVLGEVRNLLGITPVDRQGADAYMEVAADRIRKVADELAESDAAVMASHGFLKDLWWVDELFTSMAFARQSGGSGGVVNLAPVALGESYAISNNTSLAVEAPGVLANDFDPNGPALSVSVVSPPAHAASFELYADGSFSYQPQADYVGADQFVYRASDGQFTDDGTVSLLLTNQPPVANPDTAYSASAQLVTVYVLQNDYDPDWNYPLTVTAVTQPANGSAGYTSNTVTYTPNPGFGGSDAFQYTVRDSLGATSQGTVTANAVQVTGFALDRQLLDYSWTPVADDEVTWLSDTLRWTAQYSPRNPPTASSSEWRYKPWAQRDNPAYQWSTFMVVSGDGPAMGHPGAGEWAVSPKVNFYNFAYQTGFFAELSPAKWRLDAQITSITWTAHTANPAQAGELQSEGVNTRLYPDAALPGGSARTKVDVLVQVAPAKADIPVQLKWYDVDDPDHDGPIDLDPGLQGANNADNFSTDGYDDPSLPTSGTTDAEGKVRKTFDVGWIQPGNNFRVAAGPHADEINLVKALDRDASARLFFDRNNDGLYTVATGDVIVENTAPYRGMFATPELEVWRKLHIERDSMGPVIGNVTYTESTTVEVIAGGQQSKVYLKELLPVPDGNGRYEGGTLKDPHAFFPIVSNTRDYVLVRNAGGGLTPLPYVPIELRDDDSQNMPELPDTGLMQEAYAAAYILPVVDGGGDPTNNKTNVPFQLHVPQHSEPPELVDSEIKAQLQAQNGLESDGNRSSRFWVAYVQSAYQADPPWDYDPRGEGYTLGLSPDDRTKGALVFLETTRDFATARGFPDQIGLLKRRVVAHETAHLFGVADNQGTQPSIMHELVVDDPRNADGSRFNEEQRLTLRIRVKSPGS